VKCVQFDHHNTIGMLDFDQKSSIKTFRLVQNEHLLPHVLKSYEHLTLDERLCNDKKSTSLQLTLLRSLHLREETFILRSALDNATSQ